VSYLCTLPSLAAAGAGLTLGASPLVSQVKVSDSAVVAVLQNSRPLWADGEEWSVSPEPGLVIGGWDAEGPSAIYSVARFTRLRDGAVAVLQWDRRHFEIRVFESDGTYRATFGRSGDGPFEVGRHATVSFERLPGDSLRVVSLDGRVLVFGPNGERGRSGRLDYPGRLSPVWGWVGPDRFVTSSSDGTGPREGWTEGGRTTCRIESTDGEAVAELGTYRWTGGWARMNQGSFGAPFGGRRVSDVAADRVLVGASDRYEIREWNAQGQLRRVIRRAESPRAVTRNLRESCVEWQRDRYEDVDPALRRGLEAFQREIRFPSTLPSFQDLLLDEEDFLWVLRYRPPWTTSDLAWDVFDPDGRWLGPVTIAFEVMPRCRHETAGCHDFEIGSDYLLVGGHDEFDAVQLKLYELRRQTVGGAGGL